MVKPKPRSKMHRCELPKIERDPEKIAKLCTCRPVCKSRRRCWKGVVQATSAELALERKPVPECIRRWPKKVVPNARKCELFGRTRTVRAMKRGEGKPEVVRICQAPIDDVVDTTYLRMYTIAKQLGALELIKNFCPFCECCGCCGCTKTEYKLHDPERENTRRKDMREFDQRVKTDYMVMRIMYQ